MSSGWRIALFATAAAALVFLIVKLWPVARARREGVLHPALRSAREKIGQAKLPREKAEALCEAAEVALRVASRPTSAVGFLLRALRADPTWERPLVLLRQAFQNRRPQFLEQTLWRRLATVPWDSAHKLVLLESLRGLRAVYLHKLRDPAKAEGLAKLAKRIDALTGEPPLHRDAVTTKTETPLLSRHP